jgi:hypothetical protein
MKYSVIFGLCFLLIGVAKASEKTQVLILDNDQLLEGVIVRDGVWYKIQNAQSETVFPANRVWKLVENRQQAYEAIRDKTNLNDVAARLKLAQWCLTNGLKEAAVVEAQAVLQAQPQNAYAKFVMESARIPEVSITPARQPLPVAKEADLPDTTTAEHLQFFLQKVQPILMNACGNCHTGERAGHFALQRNYGSANNRTARENLIAAWKQVQVKSPEKSPLLLKAITAHGPASSPPIRGEGSPAFQHLLTWATMPTQLGNFVGTEPKTDEPKAVSKTQSNTTPKHTDAFDPEEFNSRFGPKRKE